MMTRQWGVGGVHGGVAAVVASGTAERNLWVFMSFRVFRKPKTLKNPSAQRPGAGFQKTEVIVGHWWSLWPWL